MSVEIFSTKSGLELVLKLFACYLVSNCHRQLFNRKEVKETPALFPAISNCFACDCASPYSWNKYSLLPSKSIFGGAFSFSKHKKATLSY